MTRFTRKVLNFDADSCNLVKRVLLDDGVLAGSRKGRVPGESLHDHPRFPVLSSTGQIERAIVGRGVLHVGVQPQIGVAQAVLGEDRRRLAGGQVWVSRTRVVDSFMTHIKGLYSRFLNCFCPSSSADPTVFRSPKEEQPPVVRTGLP